jgi:uncharacterized membrane protein YfcA
MIDWLLLFILGFAVAAWNSSIGPTGGALIAGTTLIVPPPGSLLLQGIAALFSNGFRSWQLREHLDRKIILPFLSGTLLAIAPAYFLFSRISSDIWMIIIGCYVIVAGALSFYKKSFGLSLFPAGFISAIASFLTGTGSLVAAPSVRRFTKDRKSLISNEALLVFLQGSIKTFLLVSLFTVPENFLFLLSALLVSVLLGNIIGLRVLEKIPDRAQGRLQMATLIVLGALVIIAGVVRLS